MGLVYLVYLYTYLHEWLILYGKLVGKYTVCPMDAMGMDPPKKHLVFPAYVKSPFFQICPVQPDHTVKLFITYPILCQIHGFYIYLELQTTSLKWMFGETTVFYVTIWSHPVETTINNWLFRVPGIYIYTWVFVS